MFTVSSIAPMLAWCRDSVENVESCPVDVYSL